MMQWDYYLMTVKHLIGIKVLTTEDELAVREAWESDFPPELAADDLKLINLGAYDGAADNGSQPSVCVHDLQHPHTTVALRGEDFQEAKCSVCGRVWINDLRAADNRSAER